MMNQSVEHLKSIAETCDENEPEADMVVCSCDLLALIKVVEAARILDNSKLRVLSPEEVVLRKSLEEIAWK